MSTVFTSSSTSPQHRGRHGTGGGEVQPQPARRVLRARLRGRVAERTPEGAVDEVGRGMRTGHGTAPLDVDLRVGGRPDRASPRSPPRGGRSARAPAPARRAPRSGCPAAAGRAATRITPAVGQLAAALGVERGPVQHDSTPLALAPAAVTGRSLTSRPTTVASPANWSYPVNSTVPVRSRRSASTEMSALPVFFCAASALARWRCSAISRRNPSSSTASPCSSAISRVSSIGKP